MKTQRQRTAYAVSISVNVLFALSVATLSSSSANAQPPSAERGGLLYENHCQFCHTPKIHARPNQPALTRPQLRTIVNHWRLQQGLEWTEEDTEDVVEYLNRTRYHFAPR